MGPFALYGFLKYSYRPREFSENGLGESPSQLEIRRTGARQLDESLALSGINMIEAAARHAELADEEGCPRVMPMV